MSTSSRTLLGSDPELSVVLVGPVALATASSERMSRHPNIHTLGPRPYADVPAYLQHADVVIVPHVITPFTESLDPIKAYECRAVGRPTIATQVAGFRDWWRAGRARSQGAVRRCRPKLPDREAAVVAATDAELGRASCSFRWCPRQGAWHEAGRRSVACRLHRPLRTAVRRRARPRTPDLRAPRRSCPRDPRRRRTTRRTVAPSRRIGRDPALERACSDTPRSEVRFGVGAIRKATATWHDISALRRRLRELNPDLVHTNSLKAAVYGGIAARLERFPVVWHIRDRIAGDYLGAQGAWAIRVLALVIPARIIYNSRATREHLQSPRRLSCHSQPGDLRLIGSVRPSRPQPERSRHAFRHGGPIGPLEGSTHLRSRVCASVPEWLGRGSDRRFGDVRRRRVRRRELEQLVADLGIGDRVSFAGFIDDIPELLQSADALVHASVIAEPFGQVVIEGMASGLPVIASAAGGPLEVITPEVDGILVPPDDVTALATQLRRLRDHPELCQALGVAAYKRAQDFSVEQVAARYRRRGERYSPNLDRTPSTRDPVGLPTCRPWRRLESQADAAVRARRPTSAREPRQASAASATNLRAWAARVDAVK